MKSTNSKTLLTVLIALAVAIFFAPSLAQAHCDGLDGPVVKAAQKALAEGNVNLILVWVQKADETEISGGGLRGIHSLRRGHLSGRRQCRPRALRGNRRNFCLGA